MGMKLPLGVPNWRLVRSPFLCLLLAAATVGCDNVGIVSGSDLEAVKKLRSGEYELIRRDELVQLQRVGRYHQYHNGGRTWRLDTGENCLMLATEADWKTPGVAAQACRS